MSDELQQGGSGTVTRLIAGPGITLNPSSGRGNVTVSSVLESWILAPVTGGGAALNPAATGTPHLGGATIVGPDLEMNADPTLISVLTAGFYDIAIHVEMHQSSDGDGHLQINLDVSPYAGFVVPAQDGLVLPIRPTVAAGNSFAFMGTFLHYPRLALPAGATVGIDWSVVMAAGSISLQGTDVVVTRVA